MFINGQLKPPQAPMGMQNPFGMKQRAPLGPRGSITGGGFAKERVYQPYQLQRFGANEGAMQGFFDRTREDPRYAPLWRGLQGAGGDQRDLFNRIFQALDHSSEQSGALLSRAANALQNPGDWEWDFGRNQWRRTSLARAKDRAQYVSENMPKGGSTMLGGFAKTNVKSTKV